MKFELVIEREKEREIDGEKCHSGYVAVDGQPFRFWNLPIGLVRQHFISTAEFCLKEVEPQITQITCIPLEEAK